MKLQFIEHLVLMNLWKLLYTRHLGTKHFIFVCLWKLHYMKQLFWVHENFFFKQNTLTWNSLSQNAISLVSLWKCLYIKHLISDESVKTSLHGTPWHVNTIKSYLHKKAMSQNTMSLIYSWKCLDTHHKTQISRAWCGARVRSSISLAK